MTTQSNNDGAAININLNLSVEAADFLLSVLTDKFRVRGGLLVPAMNQVRAALEADGARAEAE